jgi:hypothetical protein
MGGVDMMTQSALTSVLQDVRGSALFYESAAGRYGKAFPFADMARTERRHERLMLGLLKTYSVTEPISAKPMGKLPSSLTETLRLSFTWEQTMVKECSRYLGFVKQQDIGDIITIIKITSRDLHLPLLQKKLAPPAPALTPAQVRKIRDKVNHGR